MWPIARWDRVGEADARGRGSVIDPLLVTLTALAIVLSTFPAIFVELTERPKFYQRVLILLADPLLAAIGVLLLARVIGRPMRLPLSLLLIVIALSALTISLIAHPSILGAQLVERQVTMVALAIVIAVVARGRERIVVAGAATAAAITQAGLALAQLVRGAPLGLPSLGEFADDLLRVGDSLAPRGTMYHPYVLAGLALVGAGACLLAAFRSGRTGPWLVACAVAIAPVGVTYSRTALLGIALACVSLAPRALRGSAVDRAALIALVVGVGIPAALAPGGWVTRAESTVGRVPDRGTLVVQAARITATAPVIGVGPGRYDDALADLSAREPGSVSVFQEPHSVPVLLAAEAGLLAGVAFLGALVLLLREAHRSGAGTLAAYALFAPFLLLEHYPYTYAQGAVILGTWVGLLAGWGRERRTGPAAS